MKYLNKTSPNCPLNKKLRRIYDMKKTINNSKLEKQFKQKLMKACDNEIHMCWERCFSSVEGYEV